MKQAADLPDDERQQYVRRRLTVLDKALTNGESEALERWLGCEEMLQGRGRTVHWDGGSGGDGFRRASQAPDGAMKRLADHAAAKRALTARDLKALAMLGQMMEAPQWDLSQAGYVLFGTHLSYTLATKRFIEAVCSAAAALAGAAKRRGTRAGGNSSDGAGL